MSIIVVRGGKPLSGTVRVSGSKNAALPVLAASLLNEQPVVLQNIPDLEDVTVIGEVLGSLGAVFTRDPANHAVRVDAGGVSSTEPPYELVNRMRASFLVLGPLLSRFHQASVPLPGGCAIGARPVGEHLAAMEALGAEVSQEAGRIVARADRLVGTDINLNINSVGATENALMAASLAEGTTTIHNAALEPEVVDLCNFLTRCGVELEGVGTKSLTIHGQRRISAAVDYPVIPDRIEAGTYLLALVGTGGSGSVQGVVPGHLEALVLKLRECGVAVGLNDRVIDVTSPAELLPAKVQTAVYPGFPTDLQPQITAVLTRADGVSTVTERIFDKRLAHIPELARMGAQIELSGDSAIIRGQPSTPGSGPGLSGVPVEASDLRCAAALVIAGLMAEGETRVDGLDHLLRGYEDMQGKIGALGGQIRYEAGAAAADG